MNRKLLYLVAVLFLLIFPVSNLWATSSPSESTSPCTKLTLECFEHNGVDRSRCFFSAATHPFCDGTELGRLAYQRWMMSPDLSRPAEAPAFLGPELVNKNCLENFDNLWVGMLLHSDKSSESTTSLLEHLNSCKKEVSHDLTRP